MTILLAITAFLFVVTGCGSSTPAGNPTSSSAASTTASPGQLQHPLPASIQSAGKIDVASNIDYPPFEMYAANGSITGIDYDLAQAMGKVLGVSLVLHNVSYDGIIPGLVAGRYTMSMSGMTDMASRRAAVNFVDYFASGGGFLVMAGNPKNVSTLDSLSGLRVGVHLGSTGLDDAQKESAKLKAEGKPPLQIHIYQTTDQSVLALKAGRVDVTLVDSGTAAYITAQSNGTFAVAGVPYQPQPYGIAFPKASAQLLLAIQGAMQQIMDDGTYAAILAKWGETAGSMKTATINNGQGL
jgi:polar amino acid transport system substrate-binding protein